MLIWNKLGLGSLVFLFSITAFGHEVHWDFSNTIYHDVQKDEVVNSGELEIFGDVVNNAEFKVTINYTLKPRWYVPAPDQKGSINETMPLEFATEEGYQNLAKIGTTSYRGLNVKYLGRADFKEYKNCYKVVVKPPSGLWEGEVLYHPDVASVGWVHIRLTIMNIPVIGKHTAVSHLREE